MAADNSDGAAPKKRGRPFQKGVSGNPGGRPKVADEFKTRCRRIVDEKVIDAWEREVERMGDDWCRASELLAAYGYGKPPQSVEVSPGNPPSRAAVSAALALLLEES